jgi:hypothetical protein
MVARRPLIAFVLSAFLAPSVAAQVQPQIVTSGDQQEIVVSGETVAKSASQITEPRALQLQGGTRAAVTWLEQRDGQAIPMFAIRRPAGGWTAPKQADYRIEFKTVQFDPLSPQAAPLDDALMLQEAEDAAAAEAVATYCVQFVTQSLPEYQKAITQLGGRVLDYVPNYAHLVSMTPAVADRVGELPFVRWVGLYHPAYKLDNALAAPEARAYDAAERFFIYAISREDNKAAFEQIKTLGGALHGTPGGRLLDAELTSQQLDQVLRLPSVQAIEKWSPIENDMDNARIQGGANYLQGQATVPDGFTGVGVRGHIMEGVNRDHPDFAATTHRGLPIVIDDGAEDSHGNATFGIVFGSGLNDPIGHARGMLPNGQGLYTNNQILTAPTGSTGAGSRYDLVRRLVNDHEVLFQTASWGNGRTTLYTPLSAELDLIIFDHDIPITQSQSNAGDRMSRPQAWAKNVISVGAFQHFDNSDFADDSWQAGNGSIGPAEDGRIKPDLCAFYDATRTTDLTGYTDFGGTSGATPIVAGHLGLVLEMWTDGAFGNDLPNPGGGRHSNRPHFTTAKALLVASAHQYDFNGASTDNRREHLGWGLPDLRWLYDMREKIFVVDEADPLQNLSSKTYDVRVAPGEPVLKVCMTYADPPGNPTDPPTDPERVNDLTVKATSPSGEVFWGNSGLADGIASTAGGAPDTTGTVECIFVSNPEPGSWKLEVSADELLQDGRRETPDIDADFALVAIGIRRAQPPTLALKGVKTRFHLVGDLGTALYCVHHVNELKRLEFFQEDAGHWYYQETETAGHKWAIARIARKCPCGCCPRHAIWVYSPDLGINNWRLVDRGLAEGPGCHCRCSIP